MNTKEKNIEEKEAFIEGLQDRLGLKLDGKIKQTVVALQLYGFETTQSCEGHLDWGCHYPWVELQTTQENDIGKLASLIREFYQKKQYRRECLKLETGYYNPRFIIRLKPWLADWKIETEEQKALYLNPRQQEMNLFAEFLLEKYLEE